MHNAHTQEYDNLWANSLDPEMHDRTAGYWYTVTCASTAHTAFRTREELDIWLDERGLALAGPLAEAGEWSTTQVLGRYRAVSDRDPQRFESLEPLVATTVWDNGEQVPAKITEEDGVRTVHHVNCNYRSGRR